MAMRDYIFILAVVVLVIGASTGLFKMMVDIFKRFKMEKESIQEDIEGEAQSGSESLHTEQLLVETLEKIGCKPEKIDGNIFRSEYNYCFPVPYDFLRDYYILEFEYHGGRFYIRFNDTSEYIHVISYISKFPFPTDKMGIITELVCESWMATKHSGRLQFDIDDFRLLACGIYRWGNAQIEIDDSKENVDICMGKCVQCWHGDIEYVVCGKSVIDSCVAFYLINIEEKTVSLYSQKAYSKILLIKEIPKIENYLCRILQELSCCRNFICSEIEKRCKDND